MKKLIVLVAITFIAPWLGSQQLRAEDNPPLTYQNLNTWGRQVQSWIIQGSFDLDQFTVEGTTVEFSAKEGCVLFQVPDANIYPFHFHMEDWHGHAVPTGQPVWLCGVTVVFDGSEPTTQKDFEDLVYSWCVTSDCWEHRSDFTSDDGVTFIAYGEDGTRLQDCPQFYLPNSNIFPFGFSITSGDAVAVTDSVYIAVCSMTITFSLPTTA